MQLRDDVVARLLAEVDRCEGPFLPPLSRLCKAYGVSFPTILAAADSLRRRGILSFHKGSKVSA